MKGKMILALLIALIANNVFALELNRYFTDNMVLQRNKPSAVRGTAEKGSEVTVTFAGQTKTGKADDNGAWSVTLDSVAASKSGQVLTASDGSKKVTIKNVVVGDVFLNARQTSIDITLGRDEAGKAAASAVKANPMLRAISIKTIPSPKPLSDLGKDATNGWSVVDRDSALKMAASAFYLGEDLVKESDVPIGIVDINLGTSFANGWLSRGALLETGKFYLGKSGKPDTEVAGQAERFEEMLEAEVKGVPYGKGKVPPKDTLKHPFYPASGYNGILHPLSGIALKAVLVQLGNDYPYMRYEEIAASENPFDRPALSKAYDIVYNIRKTGFRMEDKIVPRITREWRKSIGDNDLPFGLIVPPGSYLNTLGQHHREMRELQRWVTVDNKNVGVILPGTENIPFSSQPTDEKLLAERCQSWIDGAVYKKADTPASGPVFDKFDADFNEATIYFKEGTAKGLKAEGDALDYFEVANVEGDYEPAEATIDGETIRIKSDTVPRIVRLRYNWKRRPDQNLVNSAGLPAIPFRSERAPYHWFVRNETEELPEEYTLPASKWKKSDVTLINANLKNFGFKNFPGWIGPAGFKCGPFGPNIGVGEIKEGSPADGKLQIADIIYSVNGKPFGYKPWEDIAAGITESETKEKNGKLVLGIRRGAENIDVELTLPVMGTYSTTAPYDCPKTEKIVANLEKWMKETGGSQTRGGPDFLGTDTLFLLATGTPENLGYARRNIYKKMANTTIVDEIDPTKGPKAWFPAWDSMVMGEYYMATGDKNVLPYIKFNCDLLTKKQHEMGGWRHNFPGGSSYGLMPALGVAGTIGFHLANDAGLDINQKAYRRAVEYYQDQAKMGRVIYGIDVATSAPPELEPDKMTSGHMATCNGGVASAAILFDMEGDTRTKHLCSTISAHAWNNTFEGHGGNFWNNFWTPLGAKKAGKKTFLNFWKNYRWYRECGRMYDGGLLGGGSNGMAGFGVALVSPRERLQIVGAPLSPFEVKAPAILKPALTAYWSRAHAKAAKIADELIAGGEVGLNDLPTVEYLSRAAKEMQKSFDLDFERMQKLTDAGDLLAAKSFLPGLEGVVSKDDPRLMAMQKKLAGVEEPRKQKGKKKVEEPTEKPRQWFCLVSDNQLGKGRVRTSRKHETIVNSPLKKKVPPENPIKANVWRLKVVEDIRQAPKEWYATDFDDSAWKETELPVSWHMYHTALLRTEFNVEDKSKFDLLRMHSWVLRQQNMEIYLNGELLAKVNFIGKLTESENLFKESALNFLKNGENTLAITTRHDWRWGRSFLHVYNDGFDFNLDARLKEDK